MMMKYTFKRDLALNNVQTTKQASSFNNVGILLVAEVVRRTGRK